MAVPRGNRGSHAERWASDVARVGLTGAWLLLSVTGCETVDLRPEIEPPAAAETEASPAQDEGVPGSVTSLSVGPRSSCAIVDGASLWCWGSPGHGLLGESPGPGPVRLVHGEDLTALAVGDDRVCYAAAGVPHCFGVVRGFGTYDYGYYSEPTIARSPERVRGLEEVDAISVARNQSCFLSAGVTRCLGSAEGGAGAGARSSRFGAEMTRDARSLATGATHTCVAEGDGKVTCWGSASAGQLPGTQIRGFVREGKELDGLGGIRQVASSPTGALTCALGSEDAVTCWGTAGDFLDGAGMDLGEALVALEGAGEPIARIAVGLLDVYAVAESGALYRYSVRGPEPAAEVRNGVRLRTELVGPESVDTPPVADVGVGLSHTCALGQDRHVRCWGLPIGGRLGSESERAVSADEPVVVRFEAVEDE